MTVQDFKKSDLSSLTHFQPTGWRDLFPIFEFYISSVFCVPIKITFDNKIAGIGAVIFHNDIAWLAHIITHPDHRKKGIGLLITNTLIDYSRSKNCETIYLIATDLGAPVYKKAGFKTETEYLFFQDLKQDKLWTPSPNIHLYKEGFKDQVLALDERVSKENRRFRLENHLENGHVYTKDSIVEGFYLPTFGEGLILAETDSAGIELMKLRMATQNIAAFPKDNVIAAEFMNKHNFKPYKKAKRMRLGIKREVQFSNIYNRIGGDIG